MRSNALWYDLLDLMTYHMLQIGHLVPIAGFQYFEKNLRLLRLSHRITIRATHGVPVSPELCGHYGVHVSPEL